MSSLAARLRKGGNTPAGRRPHTSSPIEFVDSFNSSLDDGEVIEITDDGYQSTLSEVSTPQSHREGLLSTYDGSESTTSNVVNSAPPRVKVEKARVGNVDTHKQSVDTHKQSVDTHKQSVDTHKQSVDTAKPVGKRKAKLGKQRTIRAKQFTERDTEVMLALDWLGKATLNHIAFMVGTNPKSIQKRLKQLVERGYLLADDSETMVVYSATQKGLLQAGIHEKPVGEVARSTMSHKNKINSIHVFFKIGENRFSQMHREVIAETNRKVEAHNKATTEYNFILAEQQKAIAAKPVGQQTLLEQRVMRKKPRSKGSLHPLPTPLTGDNGFSSLPQVAFPERLIMRSIRELGEPLCAEQWTDACRELLSHPQFPVQQEGFESSPTDAEREVMEQLVSECLWAYRHWNVDGGFAKRHLPDGVLVKPHMIDSQGNVRGGSWAIEMEENRKQVDEVVRVIMQSLDHPLLRGVIYFTDSLAIANLVKKAKVKASETVAYQLMREGISHQNALAQAQQIVNAGVLLKQTPHVNPHQAERSKFWG